MTAGDVRAAATGTVVGEALDDATRRYERVRYGLAIPTEEDLTALQRADRVARFA